MRDIQTFASNGTPPQPTPHSRTLSSLRTLPRCRHGRPALHSNDAQNESQGPGRHRLGFRRAAGDTCSGPGGACRRRHLLPDRCDGGRLLHQADLRPASSSTSWPMAPMMRTRRAPGGSRADRWSGQPRLRPTADLYLQAQAAQRGRRV